MHIKDRQAQAEGGGEFLSSLIDSIYLFRRRGEARQEVFVCFSEVER